MNNTSAPSVAAPTDYTRLRLDRGEFFGAFGNIGMELPLVLGMIVACGLDSASVLIVYGLMLVGVGWFYRLPLPVQPLKVAAILAISQKINGNVLFGGGLAVGLTMLLIVQSHLIDGIARVVPKCVIRGMQFGLGLQLATLSFKEFVRAESRLGYWLAGLTFILILALLGNRRVAPALVILLVGVVYACTFKLDFHGISQSVGIRLPQVRTVKLTDIWAGFLLIAVPQVALSVPHSILATVQITDERFPGRILSRRRVGWTYALMNLLSPFLSGIPVGHGSSGVAGHYRFGARTGGSVILYGAVLLVIGLFFSKLFAQLVQAFPLPILGVMLLFEALALVLLSQDLAEQKQEFALALLVGLIANGLPYGYLWALLVGVTIHLLSTRLGPLFSKTG